MSICSLWFLKKIINLYESVAWPIACVPWLDPCGDLSPADRDPLARHVETYIRAVIQAPDRRSRIMRYELTDNLPSSRCCRTSRAACLGLMTVVSSMAFSGSCDLGRHGATCRTTSARTLLATIACSLATSGRLGQDHERTGLRS